MAQRLPGCWYQRVCCRRAVALLPLSWLFGLLAGLRRWLYRCGVLRSCRLPVPVVVVGNLTVGGSGKTPLVLWLVAAARSAAGGRDHQSRLWRQRRARCSRWRPILDCLRWSAMSPCCWPGAAACRSSSAATALPPAGALLAAHPDCDVIVSDDGLQHYRLQRSVEVVVFDGRGAGNGRLLPAGPLREPLRRLAGVDAVVWNGPARKARWWTRRGICRSSTCASSASAFVAASGAQRTATRLPARPQAACAGRHRRSPPLFPQLGRSGSTSKRIRFPITIPIAPPILPLPATACC
jgi:tetraacyldisaccharide 4'-kinase